MALQRLTAADAGVFVMHDGKADLSIYPRLVTSEKTLERNAANQEPGHFTFIEKGDYEGKNRVIYIQT